MQRRSMRMIGAMLGCSVSLGVIFQTIERNHFSSATYLGIAALAALPIVGTMIVIARYLGRETDEYLRSLVVNSILWGFGAVMVADTFLGYVLQFHSIRLPIGLISMDLFVVTGMITLRIQLWKHS